MRLLYLIYTVLRKHVIVSLLCDRWRHVEGKISVACSYAVKLHYSA